MVSAWPCMSPPPTVASLAVLSVAPPRKARIISGFSDADVGDVRWVNDDRLVFDITDKGAA